MLGLVLAMKTPRAAALAVVVLLASGLAPAQETRVIRPIERPAARAPLPDGAVRISPFRPVSRERVEAAVREIAKAWGERRLDQVLAPDFRDRDLLVEALQARVPRDARLRVVAIQGYQVVDQYRIGRTIVSRLSVTVRTQVEFNDPAAGFQRRDGVNDWLVVLADPVP